MSLPAATGYAFNRRNAYLANRLSVAATHWSRFRGLMGMDAASFPAGNGLWIIPSRGVHTLGMKFPIDVLYLDTNKRVVHVERNLKALAGGASQCANGFGSSCRAIV